jgi:hypothetical protein
MTADDGIANLQKDEPRLDAVQQGVYLRRTVFIGTNSTGAEPHAAAARVLRLEMQDVPEVPGGFLVAALVAKNDAECLSRLTPG